MTFAFANRVLARRLAALLAAGTTSAAHAHVPIDDARARATLPNPSAPGDCMRLTARKEVVLTGASSPVANIVEVHATC